MDEGEVTDSNVATQEKIELECTARRSGRKRKGTLGGNTKDCSQEGKEVQRNFSSVLKLTHTRVFNPE